jgi:DNA-binding MarR family transcriptional regulator
MAPVVRLPETIACYRRRVSTTSRTRVTPRISYVVGRLDRALRREIAALVAPHGLTVPQYTALSILRDRGGLSNAQLARRSYVTPQSMNEVIAKLERDGLVARSPAANHGRILEMTLTPAGREVLHRCEDAVTEMESRMLADLDDDDRAQLLKALKDCVHRLGAGLPDP